MVFDCCSTAIGDCIIDEEWLYFVVSVGSFRNCFEVIILVPFVPPLIGDPSFLSLLDEWLVVPFDAVPLIGWSDLWNSFFLVLY